MFIQLMHSTTNNLIESLQRFAVLAVIVVLTACSESDSSVGKIPTDASTSELLSAIDRIVDQPIDTNLTPHGSKDPHAGVAAEKYVRVVLQHLQEGRSQQALESVNSGLYYHPGNAQLHAMRGSIFFSRGDIAKALSELEIAIAAEPENPAFLVNRAQALDKFERTEEAMADLNRAIQLKPDFLPAYFNRGTIYFNSSELSLALADFDQCIAIDPHVAGPYFNRAAVYDAQGKREQAIADMQRFIEVSDNDGWKEKAEQLIALWQQS